MTVDVQALEVVAPAVSGIVQGSVYGLLGLGLVLLYKSNRIFNFAQAEFGGVAAFTWIFFDEDHVYVSARCWESRPERRVANEMRRDTNQLRQNDTFLVLFDTFHDRRNGYIFYANAIGGLADSQVTDEGAPNTDWNTVWNVKTGTFDGGWTIEMAIPFKSLRYQPGPAQTWGVNLRRVVRWKNEWSYLAQVPRALTTFRGITKISSAATLVGLEAPSGSRNIELKPYALSGVATDNTAVPRQLNDGTLRAGADVKYGVTQNLTADLPGPDEDSSWSADGNSIAFVHKADTGSDIWVMGTSGGGKKQITDNKDWDGHPAWGPFAVG